MISKCHANTWMAHCGRYLFSHGVGKHCQFYRIGTCLSGLATLPRNSHSSLEHCGCFGVGTSNPCLYGNCFYWSYIISGFHLSFSESFSFKKIRSFSSRIAGVPNPIRRNYSSSGTFTSRQHDSSSYSKPRIRRPHHGGLCDDLGKSSCFRP